MIHYWKADCIRILKRVPRLIVTILLLLIYAGVLCYTSTKTGWNSVKFLEFISFEIVVAPPLFGTVELIFVYGDDMKAKTMQQAIGRGLSRGQVLGTKILELAAVSLVDLVVLGTMQQLIGLATGIRLKNGQPLELFAYYCSIWIAMMAYGMLAGLATSLIRNAALGACIYLALSLSLVSGLLQVLFNMSFVKNLHLSNYLLTSCINMLQAQLIVNRFAAGSALGIVIYLVIAYILALRIFKHKELEL